MESRNNLIRKYFYEGYTQDEMCQFLKKNGYPMSKSTLKRILWELDLKKKGIDDEIEDACQAILIELKKVVAA